MSQRRHPSKLTPRQAAFVAEYLVTLNATQAAIKAGYSPKTAPEQASRLLINVKVASAIQDSVERRAKRTEVKADRVIAELASIAFGDIGALFDGGHLKPIGDLPVEVRAMLASVEVQREKTTRRTGGDEEEVIIEDAVIKVRAWDKVRALELLAKHLGLITERREITGANGEPLNFTLTLERSPSMTLTARPRELAAHGNGNGNGRG